VPQTFVEAGPQPITVRERWADEARLLQRGTLVVTRDAGLAMLVARFTALTVDRPAFLLLVAHGPMQLVPPANP
jgi:hypothetical protein